MSCVVLLVGRSAISVAGVDGFKERDSSDAPSRSLSSFRNPKRSAISFSFSFSFSRFAPAASDCEVRARGEAKVQELASFRQFHEQFGWRASAELPDCFQVL